MSDHAQLRKERQVERCTKRNLMFTRQRIRSREARRIVIISRKVGRVLVLRLADKSRERVRSLQVQSLHKAKWMFHSRNNLRLHTSIKRPPIRKLNINSANSSSVASDRIGPRKRTVSARSSACNLEVRIESSRRVSRLRA